MPLSIGHLFPIANSKWAQETFTVILKSTRSSRGRWISVLPHAAGDSWAPAFRQTKQNSLSLLRIMFRLMCEWSVELSVGGLSLHFGILTYSNIIYNKNLQCNWLIFVKKSVKERARQCPPPYDAPAAGGRSWSGHVQPPAANRSVNLKLTC